MLVGAYNHLHGKGGRLVTQEVVAGHMSNSFALGDTRTKIRDTKWFMLHPEAPCLS
jgi:hypothetical protein